MSEMIIDLLERGQSACEQDRYRKGNVVHLPGEGTLIATGDIHGHRRNFERILSFADLTHNPQNHVLLHELIHGGDEDEFGGCLSYELLFDAIEYKLKFPDQVHFIMGNHDTTFINNSRVMKSGREMNQALRAAMDRRFGADSEKVKLAMRQFLFSQPLAVRCPNRIWLSHSLPSDRYADYFDFNLFKRKLKINDVVKPGDAYILTWGRRISQKNLDRFARVLDVDIFIVGHQPHSKGYSQAANNLLVLASDHTHGCLLPIDLTRFYTIEGLIQSIVPIASIA
jgi:predicted phosphodiesterase